MGAKVGWAPTFAAMVAVAATTLVLGSAQAAADQVSCGQTITKDTTLDNDLIECPGDGIVIGADRITLDLNGHTITGRFDLRFCGYNYTTGERKGECAHQDGIVNSGHDRVVIRNGEVSHFETQLRLVGANRNRLIDLQVHRYVPHAPPYGAPSIGIHFSRSERNQVLRTTVDWGDPALLLSGSDRNTISDSSMSGHSTRDGGDGLHLVDGSDRNRIVHSRVHGLGHGFVIEDSRRNVLEKNAAHGAFAGSMLVRAMDNVIAGNTIPGGRGGDNVGLHESDGNLVRNNTVSRCLGRNAGIRLYQSDGNVVQGNEVSLCSINVLGSQNVVRANNIRGASGEHFGGDGVRIEAGSASTLVEDNLAIEAYDDGIGIEAPDTLVKDNIANFNHDFGIEAVPGVNDGGGNQAFGNGNPLQCLYVECK